MNDKLQKKITPHIIVLIGDDEYHLADIIDCNFSDNSCEEPDKENPGLLKNKKPQLGQWIPFHNKIEHLGSKNET